MVPFSPIRLPAMNSLMYAGVGHSAENPGGIAGNILADPAGWFAGLEALCDTWGYNTLNLHWPCGALLGGPPPVSWLDVLQVFYPTTLYPFFTSTFPSVKRANRRYGLYFGGRQDIPPVQGNYAPVGSGDISYAPPVSFFVQAAQQARSLGFTVGWWDALGGDPNTRTKGREVVQAVREIGMHTGVELWPHNQNVEPDGGHTMALDEVVRYPAFMLAVDWGTVKTGQVGGNIFRGRYTVAPAGSELHIAARFGEDLITPAMVAQWIAANYIPEMYTGFETTRPDTAAYIRDYNLRASGRSALRVFIAA